MTALGHVDTLLDITPWQTFFSPHVVCVGGGGVSGVVLGVGLIDGGSKLNNKTFYKRS